MKCERKKPAKKNYIKITNVCIADETDDKPYPYCPHGPMVMLIRELGGVKCKPEFVCSAYRDKKICNQINLAPQPHEIKERLLNPKMDWIKREQLLEVKKSGKMLQDVNDPTKWQKALSENKAEAQYFFDQKSIEMFLKWFEHLKINKIVCIGAPRLHANIMKNAILNPQLKMTSFLLDLDSRFNFYYEDTEFAWYNMCNNYFFNVQQEASFKDFLKCSDEERLLIFTDPPYACRTELIATTLHQLTQSFNRINNRVHQPVPIFWVFPYFSEHYIKQQMPEFEMMDYKINYTNHYSYTNVGDKSRKQGSAARLFTNLPLSALIICDDEDYKYCQICERYTAIENVHCNICGWCTSKNGSTYRHCKHCNMCVKPTYKHCFNCCRCTQIEGHECEEYQKHQICRECLKPGHVERYCRQQVEY